MPVGCHCSLEKHVTNVSMTCFYHLRQLWHTRRTLSTESATTLVHASVMSQVDYCNVVFAAAPKAITDKLQRVLNAAARVVIDTRRFDRGLTQLIHSELHWLDAPECIKYKLGMSVSHCLDGKAPRYLAAHCTSVSATVSRHHSAFCCQLSVGSAVVLNKFWQTSSFLCRRPGDVELATTTPACSHRLCLWMTTKDILLSTVLMYAAHYGLWCAI